MGGDEGRVVGKNPWSPGIADVPFGLLFCANLLFVVIYFFIWLGDGHPGWPDGAEEDVNQGITLSGINNETMDAIAGASVLSGFYAMIFSLIFTFIYMGIMRVAALWLIIILNLLFTVLMFVWGGLLLDRGIHCRDWSDPCSSDDQAWSYVGGIICLASGALFLLWLWCIRDRIVFTAKLLSSVARVLSICPGTILIGFMFAFITVVWWLTWAGAVVQATNNLAGGENEGVPYGKWVGMMFGLFISGFWGHKVFLNIAHMTSCHVIASWYFDPDSAHEGIPCCRPVTLVGLKRSCTNYLGSIAFGSLIVAILESIYYTVKLIMDKVLGGQNCCVKMLACCCLCCLNCLTRCIEWLTEWAYCYIALYGDGFIGAGVKVYKLLTESGMGAVAQSTLVGPVLWLGRIMGLFIGIGAGYLALESQDLESKYRWSQPFIGAIIGFVATSVGLSCVDAANKCIFVCYVDDPALMTERDPTIKGELDGHPKSKMAEYKQANGDQMTKAIEAQSGTSTKSVDVVVAP